MHKIVIFRNISCFKALVQFGYKSPMLYIYQQTIAEPISFEGIGLHTGVKTKVTILPGIDNQGIVFKRVDLKKNNLVKADYRNVVSAKLCTKIQNESNVSVSTVEHLLAALYMAEIDNAVIEIDNEEVPIMDGSAKDFLDALNNIEIKKLNSKRVYLKIINDIKLVDGERSISIEPNGTDFELFFQLNYKNKIISNQKNQINFQADSLNEISEARTFCLYEDIEKIKKIGLAKGGSLSNAVVVQNEKVLNEGGLRNDKEFVNHKILDLAGDFLLSGYRVMGKVKCHQGGHKLTNMFLKKLFKEQLSYSQLELKEITIPEKENRYQTAKLAVSA